MCKNEYNKKTCICKPGFEGEICTQNINECQDDPCDASLGLKCIDLEPNYASPNSADHATFECRCENGFYQPDADSKCVDFDECQDESQDWCGTWLGLILIFYKRNSVP